MIDDINKDGTQWARFSDDRKLRFRLARAAIPMDTMPTTTRQFDAQFDFTRNDLMATLSGSTAWDVSSLALRRRTVFLMLNPSTADAFRLDPTVKKCVAFATAWGSEVVEVVNIFPYRSAYPEDLYVWTRGMSSSEWEAANTENNAQIVSACTGADRVIAAWGRHGALLVQGTSVRHLLMTHDIKLNYLELNKDGSPKHPLYIKGGSEPKEWTV